MRRRSFYLAIAIVLFLLGGSGTAVAFLIRYEPAFYVRAAVPAGKERQQLSDACTSEYINRLIDGVYNKHQWEARFTQEQINSYFAEDLLTKHSLENPLPSGISEPRLSLAEDRIRLGFRYGTGLWSTVVSLDLRVWLVVKEPNVVALEFESVHAGALPISAQSILERVTAVAQQQNIEVNWYRRVGHPVVLLRFAGSNPMSLLELLELRPGMLRVKGRSLDGAQRASAN
jgi:hypothetical protein